MYSLNRAQIIGYVTDTPEVREVGNGTAVTDLNIEIITSSINPNAENPTNTTFMNATLWRRLAEIARDYVKKGTQVYISGRLETDSWEDDQGNKKYRTKIIADDMILLSPRDGGSEALSERLQISGGINKVEVIGNITKDPELKTTPNGNYVTSFGVATNRVWRNAEGENQERTEFHNVVAWGDLAEEISKHINKGKKVYVSGRIQNRSWEGPDGQKRYTTEVVADMVKSLGHLQSGAGVVGTDAEASRSQAQSQTSQKTDNEVPEINYESEIKPEDLPF